MNLQEEVLRHLKLKVHMRVISEKFSRQLLSTLCPFESTVVILYWFQLACCLRADRSCLIVTLKNVSTCEKYSREQLSTVFLSSGFSTLGHLVTSEGIRTDPEKVSAIRELAPPTNIHGLRRFLGVASWYRRFVQNFSQIDISFKPAT